MNNWTKLIFKSEMKFVHVTEEIKTFLDKFWSWNSLNSDTDLINSYPCLNHVNLVLLLLFRLNHLLREVVPLGLCGSAISRYSVNVVPVYNTYFVSWILKSYISKLYNLSHLTNKSLKVGKFWKLTLYSLLFPFFPFIPFYSSFIADKFSSGNLIQFKQIQSSFLNNLLF